MGYLPGFATPRIVCDVPFVGKRWVHQVADVRPRARHLVLDARTTAPPSRPPTPRRCSRDYEYYDPIHTLPEAGQQWWREQGDHEAAHAVAVARATASREASSRDAALV